MGGAVLDSVPVGDDPTQWEFAGSTLILVAESKDEVLDILRRDIYTTSGVWDVEKVSLLKESPASFALGDAHKLTNRLYRRKSGP